MNIGGALVPELPPLFLPVFDFCLLTGGGMNVGITAGGVCLVSGGGVNIGGGSFSFRGGGVNIGGNMFELSGSFGGAKVGGGKKTTVVPSVFDSGLGVNEITGWSR